jgi:hypothetical protein
MNFIGIYSEDKAIKFAKVRKNKNEIAIENLRSIHKEDSAYLTALEQVESTFNKNFTNLDIKHQAFGANVSISVKPGQRYIQFPKRKVPIGSDFPTFSIGYSKGISGIFFS